MKNTKKFLLTFFLAFGFLLLSPITANAVITDGLPAFPTDIGSYSTLTVFNIGATTYLIAGEADAEPYSFKGFRWNGSSWVGDSITAGLPNNMNWVKPSVFSMGAKLYLITGEAAAIRSFERPIAAGPWIASTVGTGIASTGGGATAWSAPTIFFKDGSEEFPLGGKYAIVGNNPGTFDGYKWNGASWSANAAITNGLPADIGHDSKVTVFKMGATWYLITGNGSGNAGEGDWNSQFKGFRWSGGKWVVDTVIDNGLFGDDIYHTSPEVFKIGTQYYLIAGSHTGKFWGFHWNSVASSWVAEISDNTPPVIDSLTISDGADTYTGGITTFNTLGNITINATAHDEVGGSGLSDFRIHWWYRDPLTGIIHSHIGANGAASGSASVTIDLSTHAGHTIHYYAKAIDGGSNETQSPDWDNVDPDTWCINVNAECSGVFNYTNNCESRSFPGAGWKSFHTFIFPATPGIGYFIDDESMERKVSTGAPRFFKMISGATTFINTFCATGVWGTVNSGTDLTTAQGVKLKIECIADGERFHSRNETVQGECVTCVANGGACSPGDCCAGSHCQNGICCDNGHTCCANDGHCPADSCADVCKIDDNYCDTVTDHYCKTKTTDCSLNTACAGGVCAGTNYCKTDHCIAASHEICNLQCDSAGGNCVMVASCEDHCINLAQDAVCGEEGIDCGGPCPNPCCTQTCFSNPGCLTDAILNSSENTTLVCCGAGEECYECNPGYSWDVATSSCSPICAWQDDGCGAHGCNVATDRGESCGPVGCVGGACASGATQCVPDSSCCIADGNPYTGDPTVECCSGNGAHGFCCAAGEDCCNDDAHCPASGCSGLCSIDDGTCDMAAHTCGTAPAYCPVDTACSGIACANTNYCDTGVCRNSGLHQICDKWCDGLGNCNNWTNCIDHCTDGIPNCGETETDCGGPNCDQCCHDLDGDKYDDCDSGDNDDGEPIDCCDSGLEGSIGCAMGTRAGINPGATEICENSIDEDCDGEDNPCCHWEDFGCGKLGCDIWTHRGEDCLPEGCACPASGSCCLGETSPRCVADDLCSTFGLPDRTIMEILLDVVDWLLGIIAALAFLMIVIGGVVYLSSSGDPARIETAKKIVTYAIIGLIIAGVSYTVIHLVFDLLQ